ncbi:hypothetical protein ACP4OV_030476 [Aristida adscensionis]
MTPERMSGLGKAVTATGAACLPQCLSHVLKQKLQGICINPAMHEVGDEPAAPAVFIGGKLQGGLEPAHGRLHLPDSRELVPILTSPYGMTCSTTSPPSTAAYTAAQLRNGCISRSCVEKTTAAFRRAHGGHGHVDGPV